MSPFKFMGGLMGRNTDEDEVIFPPPDLDISDLDLTFKSRSGLVSSVF
jgi:hypothetical protein